MFDGNFRSRREVNLGSGSRRRNQQRRSTNNKEDLLKNAEAQRKKRQLQQRQDKAARLIQRTMRGWLKRVEVVRELLPRKEIAAISLCISFKNKWLLRFCGKSAKDVLLAFASHHEQECGGGMEISSPNESLWFSQKRLVRITLQEFFPSKIESEATASVLFSMLKNYLQLLKIDVPLFIDLAMCLRKWWQQQQQQQQGSVATYTTTLLIWSIEAHKNLATPYSDSLLASILLGADDTSRLNSLDNLYTTWFLPLADALTHQHENLNNGSDSLLLKATLKNLQSGNEQKILKNILDLSAVSPVVNSTIAQNPLPLVKFIHHVLSRSHTSSLTLLSSLMVRGEGETLTLSDDWVQVDDQSDNEEDDNNDAKQLDTTKINVNKKMRSTKRYARRDLLTTVKLEKIYQEHIQQLKRDCTVDPSTKELADKIVRAQWLPWGNVLLQDTGTCMPYIQSLALLLQSNTSLRPNIRVGVLSSLAFSKQFLEKLWKFLQVSSDSKARDDNAVAILVFCDLFSHYLVALNDVDFLKYHTENNHGVENTGNIMAKDVIVYLNGILHELYWTNPVLATEIEFGNPRARMLLSGTNLWNSLYERWNRLVRYSFCDESTWWFPHLASKEGDGAVVPVREQQQIDDDDDDDENDDDNESMDVESDNGQNMQISAAEAETDALADSFRDPKMARVLTSIPQALPFDRRVKLFHSLLNADKQKVLQAAASRRAMMAMQNQLGQEEMWFDGSVRERVQIRRAALYDDSMEQLNELGSRLKHRVQVTFINQHGAEEAGIDGGGVFKEFLDDLIKDGFAARSEDDSIAAGAPPLFSITPVQTLAVNLDLTEDSSMLAHYEFLGRVLGKAVYESILVEPQFCLPFLNQLLAKSNTTEDLKNLDEEYYKNLNKLRTLSEAEIEGLGMTFEMTIGGGNDSNYRPRTVELVPGGKSIPVTKKNIFQFINLVSHQRLNVQGSLQTRAFLRGFRDLIPASWVRLFSANELQKLISGDDSVRGINVPSLRQSMHYLGGYHHSQPYIHDFWGKFIQCWLELVVISICIVILTTCVLFFKDILENELSPEQQRKFLKFMTSCSRQPLLGFGSLDPVPSIQQIRVSSICQFFAFYDSSHLTPQSIPIFFSPSAK